MSHAASSITLIYMNLNKVLIIGRVTADPQLRNTPGGAAVSSFGVATNRTWMDKNGAKQEEVEFHNVVVWGRSAEVAAQYLTKGAMVLIEGRLQTRSWTDKQGGARKSTEIICERLQLGPRAQGTGPRQGGAPAGSTGSPQAGPGFSGGKKNVSAHKEAAAEELPTINVDESEEIKPEDLPF